MDVGAVSTKFLPSIFHWLFGSSQVEPEETLEDRLAQVSRIQVSPARFVGYEGQTLIFTATGLNSADQTIQGLVFSWQSANPSKIQIDDNGRATFIQPGMCEITCQAGNVTATARVLVRPGQRPPQSDEQWRNDQNSLGESGSTGVGVILPNLLN
jgi:hypothetical protein